MANLSIITSNLAKNVYLIDKVIERYLNQKFFSNKN